MSFFQKYLILLIILIVASVLRLYNISSVPPSPSLDEVSIGYNAYSLLKTGMDEYGTKFPILLRAYDDWRPALYVYLVIPFIILFDLSVIAVRLPSTILSIITVGITYFLVKELLKEFKKEVFKNITIAEVIGLFSSFLLAISPWHIYLSRLGHEANAGLAFFVFGLFLFISKKIYFSFFLFFLSFISYQSEKIIIPLFIGVLFFIYKNELLKLKKNVIIAGIIICVLLIPFIRVSLSPEALIRFKGTNILNAYQSRFDRAAQKRLHGIQSGNILERVINDRRIVSIQIYSEAYLSHFNPTWLFFNSSQDKHKVPNVGLLYLWEMPLAVLGFYWLFKKDKKKFSLLGLWILISPIPASITTDAPHAMRTYTFLPSWQILVGSGIVYLLVIGKEFKIKYSILCMVVLLSLISLYTLCKNYFIVFPATQSSSFQDALVTSIHYAIQNEKNYNKIVFSNRDALYQSYMFYLFFAQYNPSKYLMIGGTQSGGYEAEHIIDNYEFREINWDKEARNGTILFVGNNYEFPANTLYLQRINSRDDKQHIIITSAE